MNSRIKYSLVLFSLIAGCTPALYKPTVINVTEKATLEQLVEGRKHYVNKCGSCHSLYLPGTYTKEVWEHNMEEMQERAKVSPKEKQLILLYLEHFNVNNGTDSGS